MTRAPMSTNPTFSRRSVLGGGLAAVALGASARPGSAAAMTTAASGSDSGAPFFGVLRDGTPASAGLDPAPIQRAVRAVRAYQRAPEGGHPLYPGAVALMAHRGTVVAHDASGFALLYSDATTKLPAAQRVPMARDTIFDLASVSKLFTSLVAVQLVEEGALDLASPVSAYLPDFAANGKAEVTIEMLLTHTSGFPAWLPLWSDFPDPQARFAAVLAAELVDEPGTVYTYSDLNLITLGLVVQHLRGKPLDQVVAERVTGPLGMRDTGYNPLQRDPSLIDRIAATEFQASPDRGMVRGEVHDENAWSLGGVAGHAGVFSTVDDLAVLCQTVVNGGTYRGRRIMRPDTVAMLLTNVNQAFPGDDHGLGFELNQRWYMEGLTAPQTAGHTGYTGTSLVIDTQTRSFAILLTNRVHPSRDWGSINPARRDWAQGLALSRPVAPRAGSTAWLAGLTDATTATLTASLAAPSGSRGTLAFDLWLDSEDSDVLHLEGSSDGSGWAPVPFAVRDRGASTAHTDGEVSGSGTRRWVQCRATLPVGTTGVRWQMVTDADYVGRGVYLDDIRVTDGTTVLLDGERDSEQLVAEGWTAARR